MTSEQTSPELPEAQPAQSESLAAFDDLQPVVVVEVGGVQFGLRIDQVFEVAPVPPITRLPFPRRGIPGVVAVRGAVLPVLDLGARLFDVPARRDGRIVIVKDPIYRADLALLVDRVLDLVSTGDRLQDPPEEVLASLPVGWIDGVLSVDESRIVTMLNLPAVLERLDAEEED